MRERKALREIMNEIFDGDVVAKAAFKFELQLSAT